jgi:hypothetical protein
MRTRKARALDSVAQDNTGFHLQQSNYSTNEIKELQQKFKYTTEVWRRLGRQPRSEARAWKGSPMRQKKNLVTYSQIQTTLKANWSTAGDNQILRAEKNDGTQG